LQVQYRSERIQSEGFRATVGLKPGKESCKRYHPAVWPEVLDMIRECNIKKNSIYLKDHMVFSYFKYRGSDIKSDRAKMAAHPKTQQWWAIMGPRAREPS